MGVGDIFSLALNGLNYRQVIPAQQDQANHYLEPVNVLLCF